MPSTLDIHLRCAVGIYTWTNHEFFIYQNIWLCHCSHIERAIKALDETEKKTFTRQNFTENRKRRPSKVIYCEKSPNREYRTNITYKHEHRTEHRSWWCYGMLLHFLEKISNSIFWYIDPKADNELYRFAHSTMHKPDGAVDFAISNPENFIDFCLNNSSTWHFIRNRRVGFLSETN